jgi:hypothetical protein
MLYRAADGEPPKIVQAGKLGKIEILGKGQQFVAFGTHPSGAELEWFPEPPGAELRMGLPAVTEDQIHAFLEACAPIIEAESPKRANGQDHGAGEPEPIHSALPPRSPASRTAGRPTGNLGTRSAWPYSVRPAAARPGRQCSTPSQHPTPRTVAASARWEHYSTILPNLIGAGTIFHMAAEAKQRAPTEGDTPDPEILANPDMSVLRLGRRDPPAFPMEVLCKTWGNWAGTTADAAACPVDNVVAPLLASASALIGHARWAQVTPGWMEPPHLWCGAVGDSGTGKSPGADTLLRDVLPELERRMLGDFPDRLAQWRIAAETHAVAAERWKAEVRTAGKSGTPPPLPPAADIPLALLWQNVSEWDSRIGVSVIHGWSAAGEPTMVRRVLDWHDELDDWLEPFLTRLGHKARRRMCPRYIAGLIGPGDRKSVQPMAERLVPGDYDQLHHFIAAGLWDAAPLEAELLMQADRLVGGPDAVLVIDDTALPKACPWACPEEGQPFGWRCPAICLCPGEDRQLPDAGLGHAGERRGAGDGGPAAVPAGELDERCGSYGNGTGSGGSPGIPQ